MTYDENALRNWRAHSNGFSSWKDENRRLPRTRVGKPVNPFITIADQTGAFQIYRVQYVGLYFLEKVKITMRSLNNRHNMDEERIPSTLRKFAELSASGW